MCLYLKVCETDSIFITFVPTGRKQVLLPDKCSESGEVGKETPTHQDTAGFIPSNSKEKSVRA